MRFDAAITHLVAALKGTLPGSAAHQRVLPRPRGSWPAGFNPASIRAAAALVIVFPIDGEAHVLLTVRSDDLGRHRGQISLPGGVVDPGESFVQAALREAYEEVGLPPGDVTVLGELTPIEIPVSGFLLHPVVAAIASHPTWTPAAGEVARILEVAVDELLDRACLTSQERERDGERVHVPLFRVAGHDVWGATAMAVAEFLALFGWLEQC